MKTGGTESAERGVIYFHPFIHQPHKLLQTNNLCFEGGIFSKNPCQIFWQVELLLYICASVCLHSYEERAHRSDSKIPLFALSITEFSNMVR